MKRFQAKVGLDDEANGTVEFFVYRDFGKGFEREPAFASGVMRRGDQSKEVNVDLSNVVRLRLLVDDGKDGRSGDHADWADAKLVR